MLLVFFILVIIIVLIATTELRLCVSIKAMEREYGIPQE